LIPALPAAAAAFASKFDRRAPFCAPLLPAICANGAMLRAKLSSTR
jgi:hypothetical protein